MVKYREASCDGLIVHPGETLKEVLKIRGINLKELAREVAENESAISSIINGQKDISAPFAKKLDCVLGIDADFWLTLQGNYDKELVDLD